MQFDCGLVEEILEAIWKNKIDTKYGKKCKIGRQTDRISWKTKPLVTIKNTIQSSKLYPN